MARTVFSSRVLWYATLVCAIAATAVTANNGHGHPEDPMVMAIHLHKFNGTLSPESLELIQRFHIDMSKLPANFPQLKPREQYALIERLHFQSHREMPGHEGHEEMHREMVIIMIVTLVAAQILLYCWRNMYARSYQAITMFGMWLVPLYFCFKNNYVRMLVVWTVFTSATAYVYYLATRKPLPPRTPRRIYKNCLAAHKALLPRTPRHVYTYFLTIHKLTMFVAVLGQAAFIIEFLSHLFGRIEPLGFGEAGFMLIFYGLYYGVLSRDFAEVSSNLMASSIGYSNEGGLTTRDLPANTCAVCGDQFTEGDSERMYKLGCNHHFHDFCIRGWTIVGKKETCPYCKERVNLKATFTNPWLRQDVWHLQLLEFVRYAVVWQPVIFFIIQGIIWSLDLK